MRLVRYYINGHTDFCRLENKGGTMENTGTLIVEKGCPYCSSDSMQVYHSGKCPKVKAIEYYSNGTVKKVEFKE